MKFMPVVFEQGTALDHGWSLVSLG